MVRLSLRFPKLATAVFTVLATALFAAPGIAATITWDASSGTDYSWDTLSNWSGDAAEPTASDDVIFPTPMPGVLPNPNLITLTAGELANSLTFQDGYTLSGGDLTLTAGSGGVITVSPGITATIDSQLIGTAGLTKEGRGTLILTNSANSYTGTTTINMGSVMVTNQSALGADTSAILVTGNVTRGAGGGNLTIGGGIAFTRALDLTGNGMTGDAAAFTSLGSNTITGDITTGMNPAGLTATGTAVLNPNTTFSSAFGTTTISSTNFSLAGAGTTVFTGRGNWVVSSNITGPGALNKSGAGSMILTGSNSFTGIVTLGGGFLRASQNSVLGSSTAAGALTLNAGVMEFRSDTPDFNTRKITEGGSNTIFVDRAVGGSGINQTVNLGAYTITANLTQTFAGRNGYAVNFSSVAGGNLGNNNTFTNNANGLVTYTGNMWGQTNSTARTLTMSGNGDSRITGLITASGAAHDVTKTGAGTLTISGTGTGSTYTGVTNINAGTLAIADFRGVNASSQINIGSGTTYAALTFTGSNATNLISNKVINLAGTTTGGAIINANNTTNPVIFTSAFTNAGTAKTLYLGGTSTANNEIQGAIVNGISGATSLTKVGAGTWMLSGTNTYTGSTTISQGTLKISDRLGGMNILSDSGAIVFNAVAAFNQSAGGTFNYVGWSGGASSELVGALTPTAGAGTVLVTPGGGTTTLTFASMGARGAGATLNFGATGVVKFTTAPPLQNGIIATATANGIAYATYNGVDWATVAANTVGAYSGYVSGLPGVTGSLTANYVDTNSTVTTTGAVNANSLKLAPTAAQTVTLGGVLTLGTGGLLFDNTNASSVINNNGTVTNTLGQAAKEIVIITNGASATNTLTVNARIGGTTGSLTKAGARTLIIGGDNIYTGNTTINEGTVKMAAGGTLGAITTATNLTTLRQGTTLDLNGVNLTIGALQGAGTITNTGTSDATLTMGLLGTSTGGGYFTGIIQDGTTNKLSVVKNTSGTASITGLNTYTGSTTLSAGIWQATTLANIGTASSLGRGNATDDASNAASLVFNGGTLQYTGQNGTIYQTTQTPSVSINRLFTLAGNGTIDSSGTYGNVFATGTGTANNAALVFNNTGTVAFSGAGTRTLTLQGSSTGDNQIALQLVDNPNAGEALSVTKTGAGVWYLSGSNTYSGNTTIGQGVLRAQDGVGLPTTSALVLGATTTSGVLETSGSFTRSVAATATPGAVTWGGTTGGGGFAASSGNLTVDLGGAGATLTWGTGGFVGTGGTQPLILNSATALSEVTFVNGIDLNGGNRTIQVDDNGFAGTDMARITGVISDSITGGALTKTGGGLLILGNANTYTGNTNINGGTLWVTSLGNDTGTASSSVGASGGKISLGTGATSGTLTYGGPGETSNRLIELAGTNASTIIEASGTGTLILSNVSNAGTAAKTLFLRGDSYANNELTGVTAVLADGGGALSVTKDDYGTWVLSGQNTYSGTTTLSIGGLGIAADSTGSPGAPISGPVGVGTLALANGSLFAVRADRTILNNVTLANNSTSAVIGDYSLDLSGSFTLVAGVNNMTLTNGIVAGKTLTISGNVITGDTARNETWNINGSGKTIISGAITDNSATTDFFLNLTYAGYGELVLSNPGNSYTGTTTVSNGKLTLGASEVIPHGLGGSSGTFVQGNVVMNPAVQASPAVTFTATLDMNGQSETISGLTATSAGNIVIDNSSASAATLTFGANDQAINIEPTVGLGTATISNTGGGALSLAKIGLGDATISNATVTYTGSTSVSGGGKLTFNNGVDVSGTTSLSVTGSGSRLVFSGGLSASGGITSVTVDGGATLNLSNLTGEALNNVANYSLASGTGTTSLYLDLGTTSDTIGNASSTVTLGANTVAFYLSAAGGIASSTTYDLLLASMGLNGGTYSLAAEPGGFTAGTLTVDTVGGTWVRYTTGTLITSDAYWTNDQATGSWATNNAGNTNWATDSTGTTDVGTTPGLGTSVYFSASTATGPAIATTLDGDMNINKLTFTALPTGVTSVEVAPGTPAASRLIVNGGGIDVQADAGNILISSAVVAATAQNWSVDGTGTNGSMLTISGALSGSGVITKTGGGRLQLGATASGYTASDIHVNAGALELTVATALGGASGATVNINTGGTFYGAVNALTIANPLVLNGGTLSASGNTQHYSGATSVTADSIVTPVDPLDLVTETNRSTYLDGAVSGAGKITINGLSTVTAGNLITGTVVFAGNNNAWSGGMQINSGDVFARHVNALGTGLVTAAAGRIRFDTNTPNGTTWNLGNAITVDGTGATAVLEVYSDNSSASPVWPGGFTVNLTSPITMGGSGAAPFLRLSEAADIGSAIAVSGGIVLRANATIQARGAGAFTSPTVVISGTGISESGGNYSLNLNGDTVWTTTNYSNIQIDVASSYTGGTTLSAGRLILNHLQGIGTTGDLTAGTAFLRLGVDMSGVNAFSRGLNLIGNPTVEGNNFEVSGTTTVKNASRTLTNSLDSGNTLTISGPVKLSTTGDLAGQVLTLAGARNTTISGIISDGDGAAGNGLAYTGSATLTLTAANTYTGSTTVNNNAGTMLVTSGAALGSGPLNVNAGILDLQNGAQTVASLTMGGGAAASASQIKLNTGTLTLGGDVTYLATNNPLGATIQNGVLDLGGATRTFTIENSTGAPDDMTVSAQIAGTAGLNKAGAGRMVVNNDTNSFVGPLSLGGGTLAFTTIGNIGAGNTSLGAPTDATSGTIGVTAASTLSFEGSVSQSTDRPFGATTGALTLVSAGSGGADITFNGNINMSANSITLIGPGTGTITGGITQTGSAADVNLNSGTWNFSGATWAIADDVIITGSTAVANFNSTGVYAGVTGNTSNGWYIRTGGTLNLNANDVNGPANSGGLDFILTDTGIGTLNTNGFNVTTPRLDLGGAGVGVEGYVLGSGTVTVTTNLNVYRGLIAANLAGAATLLKQGPGDVTLSGNNSGLNGTGATRIDAGNLILDFTGDNNAKINSAVALDFRGGNLVMNGNAAAASLQTVTGTTLTGGSSAITINPGSGQTATLALGAFTRAANAGVLRLNLPSAGGAFTTTTANTNGMIGGWLTLKDGTGTAFAANDGAGNIVAATMADKNDVTTWATVENITDSGAGFTGTRSSDLTVNSIRFNGAGASTATIGAGVRLTVASGGVLATDAVGGTATLTGGVLAAGVGSELIFTNDSTAHQLVVGSTVNGATSVTKAGLGTLVLNNATSQYFGATNLVNGTLIAQGGNAIGDFSTVTIADDKDVTFQLNGSEAMGTLATGGSTSFNTLLVLGNNTLTINQAASGNFSGLISGGAGSKIIKQTGTPGTPNAGNLAIFRDNTGFSGSVEVNAGLFQLYTSGRMASASSFTVNKNGALLIDYNTPTAVTLVGDKIGDTTPVTLNSADGAYSGGTEVRGLNIRNDSPTADRTENIGVLTFNSGASYVSLDAPGANYSYITATNFVRNDKATLDVRGRALGGTTASRTRLYIRDATNQTTFMTNNLVGGGGATGTATMSIVPWAIGEAMTGNTGNANMGNSLVTYVASQGFLPLDFTTEYSGYATAGDTNNVRESLSIDVTSLPGRTVNALVLHDATTAAGTINVTGAGAGQNLVNTSGTFLFTLNPAATASSAHNIVVSGFGDNVVDPGITVGAGADYNVFVVNPSAAANTPTLTVTINSLLTSASAALVKSGRGTLILTQTNTYGGGTYVNEGALQIDSLDRIGSGNLTLSGGTLRFPTATVFDPSTKTITFGPGGATFDTNGNNITLANAVGNGGAGGLTKIGTGTLTLSAANSFSGDSSINVGTVEMGNNTALGTGIVSLNGTDTFLQLADGLAVANQLYATNTGNNKTLALKTGATAGTYSGAITIFETTAGNFDLFADTGGTLTVSGVIQGTGVAGVSKMGAGTVILSASNSYTGATQVNAGVLSISADSGLGTAPAAATAGQLALNDGNLAVTETFELNANRGISLGGTTGSQINVADTKTLTYNGVIASAAARTLEKAGNGTLILGGTSTFTGGTLISAGTVQIASGGNLGATANSLTINAGGLDVNGNNVSVGNLTGTGGTIANNATGTNVVLTIGAGDGTGGNYTGVIADNTSGTGTIALVKTGTGTITLSGSNTFTGTTTIDAGGTLNIVADSGLGTAPATATPDHLTISDAALSASETFELNANRGIGLGGALGGQISVADTKTLTYNGVISSVTTQGLQKAGTGTLILGGSNMHGGGTLVSAGALVVTNGAALGVASAGVQVNSGATLALQGDISVAGAGTLSLSGDGAVAGYGALVNLSGNNTWTSDISIPTDAGATRIDSQAGKLTISGNVVAGSTSGNFNVGGVGDVEISGIISGTMPLFKTSTGAGTVTLSGINTYDNKTTVGNGYLKISSEDNLGALPAAYVADRLVLRNGGGLQTSADMAISANRGITLGTATLTGGVINTDAATTLTVDSEIAGAFGANSSLTKVGGGTLVLNATNTYQGLTTVSAGTLRVNGSVSSGGVTVQNSAVLGGNGTINGLVTVESGGHLAPGNSIGTNFVDSLTLSSGSILDFEFTTVPFTLNDQTILNTLNGLTINGGGFNLYDENTTNPFATNGTYQLIQYAGAIQGTGTSALSVLNPQAGHTYNFGTNAGWIELVIGTSGGPNSILSLPGTVLTLNMRAGASGQPGQTLVSNSGTNDGAFTPSSTGTDSLTFNPSTSTNVPAGGSTQLNVGWGNTATAGSRGGQITISNDGGGTLGNANQTVSGGIYDFANPSYSSTMALGNVRVGSAQNLAVNNNTITSPAYQDSLDASVATNTSGLTAGSGINVAAGASGNLGFTANTAGDLAGTVALSLTSNANGVAGLSNQALTPPSSVGVTGAAYDYANPSYNSTLALGNVRVGSAHNLAINNTVITNAAYQDSLDASVATNTSGLTAGSGINVAAGTSGNLGFTANAAGNLAGTVTLGLTSNANLVAGLSNQALTPPSTVTVSGAAYRYADGVFNMPSTSLGNMRQGEGGGTKVVQIDVQNTAINDGYSDNLGVTVGTVTGPMTVNPSGTGVSTAVGSGSAGTITFDTNVAGSKAGSVNLTLLSIPTVSGPDTGHTIGTEQTFTTDGAVYRYATGTLNTTTAALGNVRVGSGGGSTSTNVFVDNTAPFDGYSDNLSVAFSSMTAPGVGTTIIGAGVQGGLGVAATIDFNTSTAGSRDGSVTAQLRSVPTVSGLDTANVGTAASVTITGGVYDYAQPSYSSTMALGNVRVGSVHNLAVNNTIVTNASYQDSLDASVAGNTSALTAPGSGINVAAGASGNLGFTANTAGNLGGTVTLGLTSNANGVAGLSDQALTPPSTVSVTGTAYRYAAGTLDTSAYNLGSVHAGTNGGSVVVGFNATNTAAADGFSDDLSVQIGTITGTGISAAAAGNAPAGVSSLVATITIDTSAAGSRAGSVATSMLSVPTVSGPDTGYTFGGSSINITGNVYSGQSTWNHNGGGNWAEFATYDALGGTPGIDGALSIGNDTATFGNALTGGAASVNLQSVAANVQLRQVVFNNTLGASYTIAQGTGGTLDMNNGAGTAAIDALNGSHAISAPVSLSSNTAVTVTNGADTLTISGGLSGAKTLTKQGAGTLVLNHANTHSGLTTVSAGTLAIANGNNASSYSGGFTISGGTLRLDSTEQIVDTAPINMTSGGLNLNGNDETIGTYTMSGGTLSGAGTLTAASYNVSGGTISAHLGNDTAGSTMTISGPGTTIITNNPSAGTINVAAGGTLDVTGIGGGAGLTLGAGQTLSGNGAIVGNVNINGGTFSPGASPGTMNFSSGSLFLASGQYDWEVNQVDTTNVVQTALKGVDPGYDTANIDGALNITGPFTVNLLGLNLTNVLGNVQNWDPNKSYFWVLASTTGGITGFSNLLLDTSGFTANNAIAPGYQFTLSPFANNLTLNYAPVPEPSTYVGLAGGAVALATMLWDRKRRRRKQRLAKAAKMKKAQAILSQDTMSY